MSRKLALIHTSKVFLTVETMMSEIFAEVMPDVELINIMDDSLLPEVMTDGFVSDAVKDRMGDCLVVAEKTGADAIFSLCSSLGPGVDAGKSRVSIPVIKIDDAMTEKAAGEASRIGVMATVPTTLGPTCDLIQEKADAMGKDITVERCLVEGAFNKLMRGDKDTHDALVFEAGKVLSDRVDVIVFAQASMTRLAPHMSELTGLNVLTSPRLGIEHMKVVLDEL